MMYLPQFNQLTDFIQQYKQSVDGKIKASIEHKFPLAASLYNTT